MRQRREMTNEDWISAACNVAMGAFLGLAINGLLQIFLSGFWQLAVVIAALCAAAVLVLVLFDGLLGRLVDRLFPSGVRSPRVPRLEGRKPLLRLLSVPAGLVAGFGLGQAGLADPILAMI
ncbi:MAG: hypothetical protein B7Z10_11800 [Rhodobacterales bacterium 32-66-7]|nr:MAG: hypothetical protein B7Z31_13140 [Rhodobacterales bacterium 12-65-15]OYX23167.1 MAG: hypothetical protein B7Z10_11800 [Rhodobacterales bacterium 32-66-7]